MNEKGFRLLNCWRCKKELRITITEVHYGKTFDVTCTNLSCGVKSRISIPKPPDAEECAEEEESSAFDFLKDFIFNDPNKPK